VFRARPVSAAAVAAVVVFAAVGVGDDGDDSAWSAVKSGSVRVERFASRL